MLIYTLFLRNLKIILYCGKNWNSEIVQPYKNNYIDSSSLCTVGYAKFFEYLLWRTLLLDFSMEEFFMEIWEIKDNKSDTVKEIVRISIIGSLVLCLSSCKSDSGKKKLIHKWSLKSRGFLNFFYFPLPDLFKRMFWGFFQLPCVS